MLNSWRKVKKSGTYHRKICQDREENLKRALEIDAKLKKSASHWRTDQNPAPILVKNQQYFISNNYISPHLSSTTTPTSNSVDWSNSSADFGVYFTYFL